MATGNKVCIAPFLASDPMTTAGYKVDRFVSGVLTPDVGHTTSVTAISGITNGFTANPAVTLNPDGSYEGVITWDNGAGLYAYDRISIPRSS